MKRTFAGWVAMAALGLTAVAAAAPGAAGGRDVLQPRAKGDPIFVRWLKPDDPRDRAILRSWRRVKAGKASGAEMTELGTLLFERGFATDAVRMYERAGRADPDLAEPWLLAGLVEHGRGRLKAARREYRRCLKVRTGNGWCNFYMGLVEEQLGHPTKAMHYYERAFRFSPGLSDPGVNPEVLESKLQLGALVRRLNRDRFTQNMPPVSIEPHRIYAAESAGTRRRPPRAVARPAPAARKAAPRRPARRPHRPVVQIQGPTPRPTPTPDYAHSPWGSSWNPKQKPPKK